MMRIVLIGFSGAGKSHWAARLRDELGYRHICCDDLVERKLADSLPQDVVGKQAVGEWVGQPYQEGFEEREARFVACEAQVMREVLADDTPGNTVLDTTGGVIYTGEEVTGRLAGFGTVVFLDVSDSFLAEVQERCVESPVSLIWKGRFSRKPEETLRQAMERCYADLMAFRRREYRRLAHVTLDYDLLRSPFFGVQDFLSELHRRSGRVRNSPMIPEKT